MSERLISFLAQELSGVLGKLSGQETTPQVRVSSPPPREQVVPLGLAVSYRLSGRPGASGQLAWGVPRRDTALALAALVARRLDLPAPRKLDRHAGSLASQLLREILIKSLDRARREGVLQSCGEPSGPAKLELTPHPDSRQEPYFLETTLGEDAFPFLACLVSETRQKQRKSPRILVVDDSRTVRANLKALLTAVGMQVEEAEDGEKALERFKSFRPQLCLMDLEMPGQNGLEVILAMKEIDPEAKYLMVSSHGHRDALVTAQTLGVFDYLAKPLEEGRLLEAINRALDNHPSAIKESCLVRSQ